MTKARDASQRSSLARNRLLATATRLFYAEGIHAVGIDRIIAEAGVAKATFYNHFPSKDDLVLWVGDLEGSRVQAYDASTYDRLGEVKTGGVPIRVAASPDGKWIVTSNLQAGGLTVIDAATRQHARDVPVSGGQEAGQVTILFSPDGKLLYAAETGTDQVAEVELATGKVLRRLPAGKNGDGLAIAGVR